MTRKEFVQYVKDSLVGNVNVDTVAAKAVTVEDDATISGTAKNYMANLVDFIDMIAIVVKEEKENK